MTDEKLIQATLLALTKQNIAVSGKGDGNAGIIEDFDGIWTTGWIFSYPAIYGEYSP